jgi:hypothetical protein
MSEKFDRGDFLEALFGKHTQEEEYFILVRAVKDYKAGLQGSKRFYPDAVSLYHAEFPHNRHVFFGVCPRSRTIHHSAVWPGISPLLVAGFATEDFTGRNDRELAKEA